MMLAHGQNRCPAPAGGQKPGGTGRCLTAWFGTVDGRSNGARNPAKKVKQGPPVKQQGFQERAQGYENRKINSRPRTVASPVNLDEQPQDDHGKRPAADYLGAFGADPVGRALVNSVVLHHEGIVTLAADGGIIVVGVTTVRAVFHGSGPPPQEQIQLAHRPDAWGRVFPARELYSRGVASRNARSFRLREGWRSLRNAFASIWRMRSRVTAKLCPTSSRVCSLPSSRPKRILMTFSSRGVRVFSTDSVCSFKLILMTASAGEMTPRSSMKSPKCESSSSPIGVSREIGSWAIFKTLRTFTTGISMRLAISSEVGSRPYSCTSWRDVRMSLLMVSIMCTGMRMVRAWSAIARVMACRIHHVA